MFLIIIQLNEWLCNTTGDSETKRRELMFIMKKIEFEGNKGALDCNFSIVIVLKMSLLDKIALTVYC